MSLETTIADITARLRQGKFPNEQAVSQGTVLRSLQELGWNTWDKVIPFPQIGTPVELIHAFGSRKQYTSALRDLETQLYRAG